MSILLSRWWMPRKPLQKTFSSFLSAHIQRINKPGWVQWCYFLYFLSNVGRRWEHVRFLCCPPLCFARFRPLTPPSTHFVGGTSHKIFRADISAMLCFGGSPAPRARNQPAPVHGGPDVQLLKNHENVSSTDYGEEGYSTVMSVSWNCYKTDGGIQKIQKPILANLAVGLNAFKPHAWM